MNMKKFLMILIFLSVSMFSYGQVIALVNSSFTKTLYEVCAVKADYDFFTNNANITEKKFHTEFVSSIEYDVTNREFTYYIDDEEFSIGHAKVTKYTYSNGVVDYIVEHEVEKESNGHHFYIPWIFNFRIAPDGNAMVTTLNYINLKEYVDTK